MNMLTLFVVVVAAGAVASLVFGVSSMVHNGEVGHRTSAEWMTWRVGLQAGAFVLILLAMLGQSSFH